MDLSGMTGIIVFVVAIILAILVGNKLKMNIGLIAFLFTFIIGYWVLGMKAKEITSLFPHSIFMNQLCATAFFGYMTLNGTFQGIANRLVYKVRNHPTLVPIALWGVGMVLALIGCGGQAIVVMSPIAFALCAQAGFDPLLAGMIAWGSAICAIGAPWTAGGANVLRVFGEYMGEESATKILLTVMVVLYVVFFLYFLANVFISKKLGFSSTAREIHLEKPEPFTDKQKKTVVILICFLVLMVVPSIGKMLFPKFKAFTWISARFDIHTICLIGIVIMQALGLADGRKVVKDKIPWNSVLMVTGMATLVALAAKIGVVDYISSWASGEFSARWLPLVMVIIGGLLSYVTNASSVIYPTFAPIIPALAAATGCSPIALGVALMAGANATSFSPVSGGGAQAIVGASEEQREVIGARQFMHAALLVIVFVILGAVGFFNIFK